MNLPSELKDQNIAQIILLAIATVALMAITITVIGYIYHTIKCALIDYKAWRKARRKKPVNTFKSDDEVKELKDALGSALLFLIIVTALCFLHNL